MRNLRELDRYRVALYGELGDDTCGAFIVPSNVNDKDGLRVIASAGGDWDHVSVSLSHRAPWWDEMDFVKRLFFKDNEVAIQLHVPPEDHINCHPYCLHLWRPQFAEVPRPPSILVGPR